MRRGGGGCILLQRFGKRDFQSIRVTKSCEINAITFSTMKREVQSLKSELRALRTGHLSTSEVRLAWTPEEKFDTSLTVTPSMTTGVKFGRRRVEFPDTHVERTLNPARSITRVSLSKNLTVTSLC